MNNFELIDKLNKEKELSNDEWIKLMKDFTDKDREYAKNIAQEITLKIFGNKVFFRGIIEFSNICKNDCYYCGIRKSNKNAERYRLTENEIIECADYGYELGYRTFVLQSGEDLYFTDELLKSIIKKIKMNHPDSAITLSIGEMSKESYLNLFNAGADRFLLRHETADVVHYNKLHPKEMSFENRIKSLEILKEIGYQTGCGMMIGSPYQTPKSLAMDMQFIKNFKPHMVGLGPFIPHKDTPFKDKKAGDVKLTLFILSLIRIMLPDILLPATTALATLEKSGKIEGILAGCNVIMPNLSPKSVREKYMLYDNKAGVKNDALQGLINIKEEMKSINREVIIDIGDYKKFS